MKSIACGTISLCVILSVTGCGKSPTDNERRKIAEEHVAAVSTAIHAFRMVEQRYPAELRELIEGSDPYLLTLRPDPWGNEYQYRYPGRKNGSGFDLWSLGADGQDGTPDDIANWE